MHGPWRYIAWNQFQLKVGECAGGVRGSKGASIHGAIVLVCREPRSGDPPKEIVIIVYKQVVSSCAPPMVRSRSTEWAAGCVHTRDCDRGGS